ncbi:amino acid permease [bacterium]|nr:amino acid permease [bacterium]
MEKPITKYDRYLSQLDVWSMAVGVMVGWGAFVMPGSVFLPTAGPLGTAAAMAVSVLVMLIIGANFAYLMEYNSRTGGVYSYAKEAFGQEHAFLASWFLCLSYLTIVFLNGTALFIILRIMFGDALQIGFHYNIAGNEIYLSEAAFSAFAFAAVGFLFVIAKPFLQRLFTVLAIIMSLGAAVVSFICIPHLALGDLFSSFGLCNSSCFYAVLTIVILAPWAFVGFETVSFDTAHFNFSVKKSRKILFAAIIFAALMYVALTLVSLSSVPDGYVSWMAYIADLDNLSGCAAVPTFQAARTHMGTAGLVVLGITVLAAIFTGVIGAYRAAVRVLSTMAEDHIISEKFSKTTYSIMFIMIISIMLSLLGRNTLNWFIDLTSFGAVVGFGYTSAAAYKIASTKNDRRAAVLGICGAVISTVFVVVQLIPGLTAFEAMGSEAFLLLAFWCLLGFIFYWRMLCNDALMEFSGMSTSGIVLFSLLIYSSIMWIGKEIAEYGGEEIRSVLIRNGIVLMLIIFVGLAVMMYIQNLVRKKHEMAEREKIRAVESSLAKSQLLFNVSHDIRTPMNAIIGYTKLALKESDNARRVDFLSKIDIASKHLLTLINDFLDMSQVESGSIKLKLAPVDLSSLFAEIGDLFSDQMKQKNLDFSVHTAKVKDRFVWCDKKRLTRALLNVIGNSYKFTPEGGSVSVSLYETGGENGYASYEMRVQDTGIGMSKDFVDRLFTAFERERTSTDSGLEGIGMGLAITKGIVDLMGGSIEALTAPGCGTEIIIRVKLKLAEEADIDKSAADETEVRERDNIQADFTRKRLLLVEDNEINMEIAYMLLTQLGFEVEMAENGKIAVDKIAASEPGYYDLVIMDIQMPIMDGYTATKAIRSLENKQLAAIPIVAMTANAFAKDIQASEEAGMQAHIAKPVDIDIMVKTLSGVLSERKDNR